MPILSMLFEIAIVDHEGEYILDTVVDHRMSVDPGRQKEIG